MRLLSKLTLRYGTSVGSIFIYSEDKDGIQQFNSASCHQWCNLWDKNNLELRVGRLTKRGKSGRRYLSWTSDQIDHHNSQFWQRHNYGKPGNSAISCSSLCLFHVMIMVGCYFFFQLSWTRFSYSIWLKNKLRLEESQPVVHLMSLYLFKYGICICGFCRSWIVSED